MLNTVMIGMSETVYNERSEEFIITLEQKAENLRNARKLKEALSIYFQIKTLKEEVFGKVTREYCSTVNTIATLFEYIEEYERAIQYHQMVKIIKIKLYGEDSPQLVNTLCALAANHERLKNYNEAIDYCEQSAFIKMQELGDSHRDYRKILDKIIKIKKKKGDIEGALETRKIFEESIKNDRLPKNEK